MATYGELIARIAGDLKRRDLGLGGANVGDTKAAIGDAILEYQVRNWWFLTTTTTVPTVAAQNFITRPETVQRIRRVSIPALGMDLCPQDLTELELLDEPTPQTGQPELYAEGEGGVQLRLWPTPSAVWTVKISGTKRLAPLLADDSSNVWTDENAGYPLIRAAAKKRLCRFPLRDERGALLAAQDEAAALQALNSTNIDRLGGPVRPGW